MNFSGEQRLLIAHRGAPHLAPELTIPSFRYALHLGARFIETDVQRTRDGVLINFHDDTLKRTTNVGEIFPGRVNDPVGAFTYDELMMLRAGKVPQKDKSQAAVKFPNDLRIPTLEEFLELFGTGIPACPVIELKKPEKYPGIEGQVLSILYKKKFLDPPVSGSPAEVAVDQTKGPTVILASFNGEVLSSIRGKDKSVEMFFIGNRHTIQRAGGFRQYIETAHRLGSHICLAGNAVTFRRIKKAREMGIGVYVYTIDSFFLKNFFFKFDIQGIVTNRIDKLL